MKRILTVMFSGALLATLALAADDANFRYHMKTGRDLPSVEQARNAAAAGVAATERARDAALERAGYASDKPVINDAELRFQMKNGQFAPQVQKRLEALGLAPVGMGFSPAAPAHNDAAFRYRMKTGRDLPVAKPKLIAEEEPCCPQPCPEPCCPHPCGNMHGTTA